MNLLFLLFVAELNPNLSLYELDSKAITRNSENNFFFIRQIGGNEEGKEEGGKKGKKENQYLRNIYNNFISGILMMQDFVHTEFI